MGAWYEIIVTGTEDALRGFVAGCEAPLGGTEAAIFGHDLDLEGSRLSQRLKDLFAAGSHHLVFAPPRLAEELFAALKKSGREAGLSIESLQEIALARLPFSAEAFSREVTATIREKLLAGLPPGVRGEGIEETEDYDPEARGAELYTPEHAYVYRVGGAFSGPLEGVVEMQRRARTLPFVRVKPIELETRAVETPRHAGA